MLRVFSRIPRFVVPPSRRWICMSNMSRIPLFPKFISLEGKEHTAKDASNGFRIRVVSYNILAQVYVKSSYFPYCPSSCLKWRARSQAVLESMKSFNADFLCIQELDEYHSFYKSNMESDGYSSIYVQRNGQKRDGCGIFYNPKRAELVLNEEIYYNDLVHSVESENGSSETEAKGKLDYLKIGGTPTEDLSKNKFLGDEVNVSKNNRLGDHEDPNDPRVRLKRDCVGLLAAFKLNDPSNHLMVVANTHIYWDPEWADVKLAQAKYLLLRIARFSEIVSNKYDCTPSVVLAGDFNSTPGDQVYRYLVSSNNSTDSTGFPMELQSLYATNGGEPPFTNYTPGFTGTLDYIFLSGTGRLKPVGLLEIPGPGSTDIIGGLPNQHHPSDHLPIGGDFEVLSSSSSDVIPDLEKLRISEEGS